MGAGSNTPCAAFRMGRASGAQSPIGPCMHTSQALDHVRSRVEWSTRRWRRTVQGFLERGIERSALPFRGFGCHDATTNGFSRVGKFDEAGGMEQTFCHARCRPTNGRFFLAVVSPAPAFHTLCGAKRVGAQLQPVQETLMRNPHNGHLLMCRGRRWGVTRRRPPLRQLRQWQPQNFLATESIRARSPLPRWVS